MAFGLEIGLQDLLKDKQIIMKTTLRYYDLQQFVAIRSLFKVQPLILINSQQLKRRTTKN